MKAQHRKRILITVLNWGLGHATRCLPLIRKLQAAGHEVILASDGRALTLLQQECPDLTCLPLPAHNIYYGKRNFMWHIVGQLPKIAIITLREHWRVRQIVKKWAIDEIISDNRFGCFHPNCRNIFMTHQLNIIINNRLLQSVARGLNKRWIRTFFDVCQVPDVADTPNLSGILSHDVNMPNLRYIGVLSRMKTLPTAKQYDWVAVLSGPEPQRSILEEMILRQARALTGDYHALIVGGKTEVASKYAIDDRLEYRSFMTGAALNKVMCAANLIICRSGYSTLMDLAKMGGRAVLIPTPGQSEQEYLAKHLNDQGLFFTQSQSEFHLLTALKAAKNYPGFETEQYSRSIEILA